MVKKIKISIVFKELKETDLQTTNYDNFLAILHSKSYMYLWQSYYGWETIIFTKVLTFGGFPAGSAVQETQVQSLGQEDSPGEGTGNPLQYSCLENSPWGHKSQT